MRKLTAVIVASAIVAAGFPTAPVLAQASLASTGAVLPSDPMTIIRSTINAFPSGGEPLKLAISDLIVQHPEFAARLATYLRDDSTLPPEQRQAIVAGLADALNRLGILAQTADGLSPMWIALLAAGGALAGLGIYEATKKSCSGSSVSPNC
jgi:hypothetical protein